jgi:hypothetical protein
MDWLKIGSAALMIGMLLFIYPRMKHAMKNSPKGTNADWMGFVIPLIAVIGFVVFLIMIVRG